MSLRLVRRLSGEAGPTEVWLGRTPSGDPVAVKKLVSAKPDHRIRFEQECAVVRLLGGQRGIVAAVEAPGPEAALVMEYLEGRPAGPLAGPALRAVAAQLATALSWLHGHQVIHRDVKPSNLMFAPDGTLRLIDFSTAAVGDPPRGLPLGWIEERVGTLGYAAPELLRDAATATPAVDFYGLGATLYELTTACLPFDLGPGEPEESLRARIAGGEPPVPIEARGFAGPPHLGNAIMAMLAVDPTARAPGLARYLT